MKEWRPGSCRPAAAVMPRSVLLDQVEPLRFVESDLIEEVPRRGPAAGVPYGPWSPRW